MNIQVQLSISYISVKGFKFKCGGIYRAITDGHTFEIEHPVSKERAVFGASEVFVLS